MLAALVLAFHFGAGFAGLETDRVVSLPFCGCESPA